MRVAILERLEQNESTQIMKEKSEITAYGKMIAGGKNPDTPIGMASLDDRESLVNITDLIRSVQRTEGNADCFKKHKGGCNELECEWRPYCLEALPASE